MVQDREIKSSSNLPGIAAHGTESEKELMRNISFNISDIKKEIVHEEENKKDSWTKKIEPSSTTKIGY